MDPPQFHTLQFKTSVQKKGRSFSAPKIPQFNTKHPSVQHTPQFYTPLSSTPKPPQFYTSLSSTPKIPQLNTTRSVPHQNPSAPPPQFHVKNLSVPHKIPLCSTPNTPLFHTRNPSVPHTPQFHT